MYLFKTLRCTNCQSVFANLPEDELRKLHGLSFRCECCNHLNLLNFHTFTKSQDEGSAGIYNMI